MATHEGPKSALKDEGTDGEAEVKPDSGSRKKICHFTTEAERTRPLGVCSTHVCVPGMLVHV